MSNIITTVNENPISRELFEDLATIAVQALSGERRELPPDAERCLEDIPPGTVYLTDCPENQMGMAIAGECNKRFSDDNAVTMATSFHFRREGFRQARRDALIAEFTRSISERTEEIHRAVLYAAAECPLTPEGHFDDAYVVKIRQIIETEGMDSEP